MDWIMVRTSLYESPKLLRISRLLKCRIPEALGLCVTLWSKAYGLTRNGNTGYAPEDLDMLIGKKGLCKALVDVGWATENADGCLVLTDWNKYCGQQQERQEAARLRQQKHRDNKRNVTLNKNEMSQDVTVTVSDASREVTALGRKEGRKEDKKDTIVSKKAHTPSSFLEVKEAFPQFAEEAVERWFLHRSAQGWVTSGGVAIRDWRADLQLWMRNEPTLLNVDKAPEKITGAAYVPTVDVEVN